MLRLAVTGLCGRAPLATLARGFAVAPGKSASGAAAARRQQAVYYARITRKWGDQVNGQLSLEAVDRTARFLTARGISQTNAIRAISRHVVMCYYSPDIMEAKIEWLSNLGLSHDKINDTIIRHPNILGRSIEKYEALTNWFISHGVPSSKITYVFNVFPHGVSHNIANNLEPKVNLFKQNGCSDNEVARILTMAPQMLSLGIERLQENMDYLAGLGIPREKLPAIIARVPQCLGLSSSRIQETVDTVDKMFGEGAGVRALMRNSRIVMHNVNGIRRSFDYLSSLGMPKDRIEKCIRFIMRSVSGILRPRVQFLKAKGVDVVDDVTWILMSEERFIKKYPDFAAYVTAYKARLKKKSKPKE